MTVYAHRPVKPPTKVITPLSSGVRLEDLEEVQEFAEAFSVAMIVTVAFDSAILLGSEEDVVAVINYASEFFFGLFRSDPPEV